MQHNWIQAFLIKWPLSVYTDPCLFLTVTESAVTLTLKVAKGTASHHLLSFKGKYKPQGPFGAPDELENVMLREELKKKKALCKVYTILRVSAEP